MKGLHLLSAVIRVNIDVKITVWDILHDGDDGNSGWFKGQRWAMTSPAIQNREYKNNCFTEDLVNPKLPKNAASAIHRIIYQSYPYVHDMLTST